MSVVQRLRSTELTTETDRPLVLEPPDHEFGDDEEPTPSFIYVGEYAGEPAYYSPLGDAIMVGRVTDEMFVEQAYVDSEDTSGLEENLQGFIQTARESDVDFSLSKQAAAVIVGTALGSMGLLAEKQALVYTFRELFEIDRQQTAQVLEMAPSTVDTHFQRAVDTVESARAFREEVESVLELISSAE